MKVRLWISLVVIGAVIAAGAVMIYLQRSAAAEGQRREHSEMEHAVNSYASYKAEHTVLRLELDAAERRIAIYQGPEQRIDLLNAEATRDRIAKRLAVLEGKIRQAEKILVVN